jgi:hypothetical protein
VKFPHLIVVFQRESPLVYLVEKALNVSPSFTSDKTETLNAVELFQISSAMMSSALSIFNVY